MAIVEMVEGQRKSTPEACLPNRQAHEPQAHNLGEFL